MTEYPDINWINEKYSFGINPLEIKSLLSFPLLWNLFHKELVLSEANKEKDIDEILTEFVSKNSISVHFFDDEANFYRRRANNEFYYDNINQYIKRGLILEKDYKDLLRKFLNNDDGLTTAEITIAIYHLIRRLRNNFSHGFKDTGLLHQQELNFQYANSYIKKILELV